MFRSCYRCVDIRQLQSSPLLTNFLFAGCRRIQLWTGLHLNEHVPGIQGSHLASDCTDRHLKNAFHTSVRLTGGNESGVINTMPASHQERAASGRQGSYPRQLLSADEQQW